MNAGAQKDHSRAERNEKSKEAREEAEGRMNKDA